MKSNSTHTMEHFLRIGMVVLLTVSVASGCTSLRKKFTRTKKENKEKDFIPVLVPEEYASAKTSVSEDYEYYHSLWKVWVKEMRVVVEDKGGTKRQQYILEQMLAQLNGMKSLVYGDKVAELDAVMEDLDVVRYELDEPEPMRNYTQIGRVVRRADRTVRKTLNAQMVESYLKK